MPMGDHVVAIRVVEAWESRGTAPRVVVKARDAPPWSFGHGHPQASGGGLPLDLSGDVLRGLGFTDGHVAAALG